MARFANKVSFFSLWLSLPNWSAPSPPPAPRFSACSARTARALSPAAAGTLRQRARERASVLRAAAISHRACVVLMASPSRHFAKRPPRRPGRPQRPQSRVRSVRLGRAGAVRALRRERWRLWRAPPCRHSRVIVRRQAAWFLYKRGRFSFFIPRGVPSRTHTNEFSYFLVNNFKGGRRKRACVRFRLCTKREGPSPPLPEVRPS